jgi:hypothetical protein
MGSFEGERGTRLDPYYREKINVRDLPELVEEDENFVDDYKHSDLEKGTLEDEDWD